MSHLSWLIQRLIRRERELAFRTQVKTEFNFLAIGTSFRLCRYSPLIGLDLIRKFEAVNGVSRVICGDRVLYCVVVISEFQREFDTSSAQRLSIARVVNTNAHRKLVSRLGLRSGRHSYFEDAKQHSAQLHKAFRCCQSEFLSLNKRVVQPAPTETRRGNLHQLIQRPLDLLNGTPRLLLKRGGFECLDLIVCVNQLSSDVSPDGLVRCVF